MDLEPHSAPRIVDDEHEAAQDARANVDLPCTVAGVNGRTHVFELHACNLESTTMSRMTAPPMPPPDLRSTIRAGRAAHASPRRLCRSHFAITDIDVAQHSHAFDFARQALDAAMRCERQLDAFGFVRSSEAANRARVMSISTRAESVYERQSCRRVVNGDAGRGLQKSLHLGDGHRVTRMRDRLYSVGAQGQAGEDDADRHQHAGQTLGVAAEFVDGNHGDLHSLLQVPRDCGVSMWSECAGSAWASIRIAGKLRSPVGECGIAAVGGRGRNWLSAVCVRPNDRA